MKYSPYIIITLLLLLINCTKKKVNTEYLLNSTIEIYKKDLPKKIIFYREKNNIGIKDTKNYIFLDAKGLLERNDENFLSLYVKEDEQTKVVGILSFKTGKGLTCIFDKNGKLVSKEMIQTKLVESKPYYIYYEILKRKYPNYMNWKLFPIPKDSLK
ncbi:hypothetical protein [Chryseobacterium sp. JM1]|uniref:hypothetical protein n=1 Tax=Chryseobacterium sp. JM1 TaxID=1233950 RepID=UPI0004E61E3B|nr:hypothetical protein [Chryseobacterium sp. JM1]KFF17189.1 hypothetical protein IW22_21340 [Chryseobacterium sp. JM1]